MWPWLISNGTKYRLPIQSLNSRFSEEPEENDEVLMNTTFLGNQKVDFQKSTAIGIKFKS